MGSKTIVFDRSPSHLQALGPRVTRTNAISPVIVGREIATRPAKERDVQILRGFEYVLAEAFLVGKRRALLKHTALNTSPAMLEEVAVDLGVDLANHSISVDLATA